MNLVKAHGAEIPKLGFGTFQLNRSTARKMVREALAIGYRHIDTAQAYGNEKQVGRAIRESSVDRTDVFLTTKVWVDRFRAGDLQHSVRESLDRLETDYVDLLLLHWPNPDVPLQQTIDALNEAQADGLARHIGISNFTTRLIDEAVSLSDAPLVTNQVEYHPLLNQDAVLKSLRSHGMALTAYAPVAQGRVFGHELLGSIGERHDKNAGQVSLRWLLQQDHVVAIPRTSSIEHARQNFDVFDFELDQGEMESISRLTQQNRRVVDPPELAPVWD